MAVVVLGVETAGMVAVGITGLTSRLRATWILGAARRMVEIYSAVVEDCRLFGGTGGRMTDPGGWFILAGA